MWSYHRCGTSDCLCCQLWCRAKTRHPLRMPLNDVRDACDRIKVGEEAWSPCQVSSFRNNHEEEGMRLWGLWIWNRIEIQELTSLGSREIKSRWNWGSITCIICLTCVGSQLSINSSSASSFSGPVQLCNRGRWSALKFTYCKWHIWQTYTN